MRHHAHISGMARRMARTVRLRWPWIDEEDLLQEGLLRVWRQGAEGAARALAMVIARRAMLDTIPHRRVTTPPIVVPLRDPLPLSRAAWDLDPALLYELRERLQALNAREQQIVDGLLCGKTAREIAVELGCTEGRISQIRKTLQHNWEVGS